MRYTLIQVEGNTYEQESTTTTVGEGKTPEEFLERCFQHFEEGVEDPTLHITVETPDRFWDSGGYANVDTTFEDEEGNNLIEIFREFPW